MKYLLINLETYAGDHCQSNKHVARAEDHQKNEDVANAVAKEQFDGYWDDSCSGFNTDCYLWHRVAYNGIKEISEEEYNEAKKYVDAYYIFSDEELEAVKKEMEEGE